MYLALAASKLPRLHSLMKVEQQSGFFFVSQEICFANVKIGFSPLFKREHQILSWAIMQHELWILLR